MPQLVSLIEEVPLLSLIAGLSRSVEGVGLSEALVLRKNSYILKVYAKQID